MTDKPNIYLTDLSSDLATQLCILKLFSGSQILTDRGNIPLPAVDLRREPLSKERSTRGSNGYRRLEDRQTIRNQTTH